MTKAYDEPLMSGHASKQSEVMSKKQPPGKKEISEAPVLTDKTPTAPVPADKAPVKSMWPAVATISRLKQR